MPRSLLIALVGLIPCLSACQVVVTAGRGMVDPLVIEHRIELGDVPPMGCMPWEEVVETDRAETALVTIAPLDADCQITVDVERAELIDVAQAEELREQLAEYDMAAVVGIEIVVDMLRIVDDESGRDLELSGLGDMVLTVDGTRVYDRSVLQSPYEERVAVPDATQARLLDAIVTGRPLYAEVELVVTGPIDRELPRALRLQAQLQPVVHIDATQAL
ncbi:MAG: hypothetical protein AB8I08_08495 [Sandaracinaceae bacterium]